MKINNFQTKVGAWCIKCFGLTVAQNKLERNHRFLEESLELVQSLGCSKEEALMLVDYVFSRPIGEPYQEVGGVMVTLAALCEPNFIDLQRSAELEYNRINSPDVIDKIRVKQATKPHPDSPLPGRTQP